MKFKNFIVIVASFMMCLYCCSCNPKESDASNETFVEIEKQEDVITEEEYLPVTLEYFENIDCDYTIDDITREIGPYNSIVGSGATYYVWNLSDGTSAQVYFSSSDGKVCRISICGEETVLLYNRWDLIQGFLSGDVMAHREGSEEGFYISDLNMDTDEWDSYSIGDTLDLDNDGDLELIINGPYGGMYLDVLDNEVIVFAEGEGSALQLSYVYYDEAYWIVTSDTIHSGRTMYSFIKYNGTDNVVDSFELNAEYWGQDNYNENSVFTYRGDTITMGEYEEIYSSIFAS